VFRLLLLVSLAASGFVERSIAQDVLPAEPRPVKDVTRQPKAADVEFAAFDFEQPNLYELSVHFGRIDGEPSIGARYGIRAVIGGERAIAWAALEVIDQQGERVQPVIVAPSALGGSYDEWIGMMTVPALSFRVALSGETVDGQPFRRIFGRLFRPVNAPPHKLLFRELPGFSREDAEIFQRQLDEQAPVVIAEREALVAQNPSGKVVMPRMSVSNVSYAPLLSRAGAPIGVRVAYDVTFSRSGEYSPGLRIAAEGAGGFIIGRNPLIVMRTAIEPLPRDAYAPHNPPVDTYGFYAEQANFLYEGSTVYTFTIELVPNYVVFQNDHVTACLSRLRFGRERDPQNAFSRMLANEGPTTYRLYIGTDAFEGRVEKFYGEGTFYRNLVADGLPDCDEKPPLTSEERRQRHVAHRVKPGRGLEDLRQRVHDDCRGRDVAVHAARHLHLECR
jgi:hypothetical protein